ncbi:hypothetical protein BJ123_10939 [Rhodopseudomonas thermotolerans]|uniref:Porin n=3 Tax=Nitrobacteraceae TaxID=41294 RepID=A0A336JMI2_9BRAD|nr:hypothetical protein BJ125_10939 [Rhodopseudomonas pentothenatexigens]REG03038.1 hypothetical protein BJ123_10939 [Rhodopseudomonas thermotolerans]SSW90885.1 hypothetical protein SAMN05892882_10939 [Rhodopseudomonas pentothenatexigens]
MNAGMHRSACDLILGAGLACGLAVGPAAAQAPGGAEPGNRPASIMIGGASPPAPRIERCVEVEIGGANALGCLNQKLQREVAKVNPTINLPPLDARSADVRIGNVNEAAVRQQYGANYGQSVVPFRPPAPVYFVPGR